MKMKERVIDAVKNWIEYYSHREGPHGVYLYGTNNCVRDFRDIRMEDYGKVIAEFNTHDEASKHANKLDYEHYAHFAIKVMHEPDPHAVALVADKLKLTATQVAAVWMLLIEEMGK